LLPHPEIRRILVADVQVPFVVGGAELYVRALVDQLKSRGYEAELVTMPFRPQPKTNLLAQAAAWRLLDLTRVGTDDIDLLIVTRFPSYFARHPRKVAWLTHQHRAAYELCGTSFSDFTGDPEDVGIRRRLHELDQQMLGECHRVFTIARNVSNRLEKYNGVKSEALYHPPPLAAELRAGRYDDYILTVGRLETIKRTDLAIRALAHVPKPLRLVVAGRGVQQPVLERLAAELGVSDRVTFTGGIPRPELIDLYANALGVIYTPFDEDYGYVTLEGFLARKPVITATDSGGTLEFIDDGVNGLVCDPTPEALGAAMSRLAGNRHLVQSLGDAGFARARAITWDGVAERLVG
jgi:glycosyltransferase involved in cell wall biosynthesis